MIRAYHQPQRLEEALGLIARGAQPVGGATGLYSAKSLPEGELVDLGRLGLDGIAVEKGRLVLGATVNLTQIAEAKQIPGMEGALLRRVARQITSLPMRNMITLGGNLAHVAYWSDMPVPLLALDALVETQKAGEPSKVTPLVDCLKGGKAPWADGLITRVLVPLREGVCGFGHERFARTSNDYPFASACATLRRDGKVAREVRVAIGALQSRAFRLPEVEAMLEGKAFDDALLEAAAQKVRALVQVAPNFRASTEYRRELAGTLARRALKTAFSWAMQEN